MDVEIGDMNTTMRMGGGDSQDAEKLLRKVLAAVEEREAHQKRVRAEQRITGGVSQELEEVA